MLSFSYLMDDCCEKYTRRFTDGGMAFYPLARMTKLESLVTASALFGSPDILQAILSSTSLQSSLKTLKLMTPVFENLPKKWTTFEATTVAENLGKMKNLIKLGIEDSYLEPIQVRTMLSDLPHLRCLELSGQAGDFREVTVLRDTEFRFIAQVCPALQQLDLSYTTVHALIKALRLYLENVVTYVNFDAQVLPYLVIVWLHCFDNKRNCSYFQ